MPTTFPGSNDSFSEPSAPASTPLDDDGGSGRDMVDNHEDLGDAIMAMQAQATLLAHSHDGTTRQGPKLTQANTHQTPDTDTDVTAIHHTIGTGANQGAAGNHSHTVSNVWPVGAIFITEVAGNPASAPHSLPGTWTAITGSFLVAAGSTFTGGSTGGASSHTHTATYGSAGSHTHSSPAFSSDGSHSHTVGSTGSSTFSHTHGSSSSNSASSASANAYDFSSSAYIVYNASHSHSSASSNNSAHSHSTGDTGVDGLHTHTWPDTDSEASHTHTSTINSAANINLPSYLVVYMWYRSA